MGISYGAFLQMGHDASTAVRVDTFRITEQYNSGWNGYAILTARSESDPLGLGGMFYLTLVDADVRPGSVATLLLAYASQTEDGEAPETDDAAPAQGADDAPPAQGANGGDPAAGGNGAAPAGGTSDPQGWIVRAWPSVVVGIEPFKTYATDALRTASCVVRLADPVSYLASRPIWGAYRGCSVGAMIGGALSMAAGGDGKPSTAPILPGLPIVDIVESVREELKMLPYSIASGQSMGEWLGEVTALLGVRIEMLGNAEGRIALRVTDQAADGTPMEMSLTEFAVNSVNPPGAGAMHLSAIAGHSPTIRRGGLLDDPTLGSFRYVDRLGSIGNVQRGNEIGLDEAVRRLHIEREAVKAEMLMLQAETGQPGNRPGRLVSLDQSFMGVESWQLAKVRHAFSNRVYGNQTILLPGETTWHPRPPPALPARFVSGIVDGGDDATMHEPVSRDRLGRIPVALAFTPTPMGEEAATLAAADKNRDMRITLEDFSEDDKRAYREYADHWEEEARRFHEGEYDDPYIGRDDSDLTEEELAKRKSLGVNRANARKYIAYKEIGLRAEMDRDSDGYVTGRDELMSDELKALMDDPAARADLEAWSSSYREGGLEALRRDFPDDYQNALANIRQILEYGALFHGDPGPPLPEDAEGLPDDLEEKDGILDSQKTAWREAGLADERWPPRLPLGVIAPMAGTLHGFIHAHRQGDICRIAIHNALYAEVTGFQYRSNRQINEEIVGATAGIVVEHNLGDAWSGVVFQPAEDLESANIGTDGSNGSGA